MAKTLEKEVEKKTAICRGCDTEYNLRKRLKEIKDIPKPNTAHKYCSNYCWVIEDAAQDYA